MATILQLKRRIGTAQNVSKTTRAMQLIAASKLKRAQDATLFGRPYVEKLTSLSQNLAPKVGEKDIHAYLKKPEGTSGTLLFVLAPDKGLCGGLVTNLTRALLEENLKNPNCVYVTVGKKMEGNVVRLKKEIAASFKFGTTLPNLDMVYPLAALVDDYFLNKKVNRVAILYTSFLSVFSQKPKITTILPLELPQVPTSFTLFEPDAQTLLPTLLRHYLEMTIYQHLVESYTSEQGARMIAMQNATTNALDIATDLKLEYNKERQERITNEILDISSAFAQSL